MENKLDSLMKLILKLIAASMLLYANPVFAQSSSGLALSSDKPVQIDGDTFEILEDQGIAIFSGAVVVVQDDTVLKTSKLTIYYDQSSQSAGGSIATGGAEIDRLVASGGVNIQSGKQSATGDTGTYDMKSEVMVLSGKRVTLSEDGTVATGCKLTVTTSNNRAKLEGCGSSTRPTVLIQPRNAN